jgi:deoxyribonuclease V
MIISMMKSLHSLGVTPEQAIRIQENLRHRIILKKTFSRVRTIGGGDVSYQKEGDFLFGAVVVLSFPQMETLDVATGRGKVSFPYLPGLLTFREGPILIKTFHKLRIRPDIMIFDGQGIAHPRGIGLATHLGIWFNLPSIGCAKTPLLGESVAPGPSKGSFELILRLRQSMPFRTAAKAPLSINPEHTPGSRPGIAEGLIQKDGQEVGVVLRTKDRVRPVFVSPGHCIDLPTSIRIILECCQGFRIPEPLRRAHHFSRILREKF